MDVFDCGAVLFESGEDEEALRVECVVTGDGELRVLQQSDGPLTAWSFDETPHRVELAVDPAGVRVLCAYFHVDGPSYLPAVLRMEYTGHDCLRRIRDLCEHLELGEHVQEVPQA